MTHKIAELTNGSKSTNNKTQQKLNASTRVPREPTTSRTDLLIADAKKYINEHCKDGSCNYGLILPTEENIPSFDNESQRKEFLLKVLATKQKESTYRTFANRTFIITPANQIRTLGRVANIKVTNEVNLGHEKKLKVYTSDSLVLGH